MENVTVSDIATKRRSDPDEEGDVWFAIKATVTNNSAESVTVYLNLQAVDGEDFELMALAIVGALEPGETKVLTDRQYMPGTEFDEIAAWQVVSCDAHERD